MRFNLTDEKFHHTRLGDRSLLFLEVDLDKLAGHHHQAIFDKKRFGSTFSMSSFKRMAIGTKTSWTANWPDTQFGPIAFWLTARNLGTFKRFTYAFAFVAFCGDNVAIFGVASTFGLVDTAVISIKLPFRTRTVLLTSATFLVIMNETIYIIGEL